MDREKRLVLEDANGFRTYFYAFPSVPPAEPGGRDSEGRGGSCTSRPSGNGTFFNSRLVGLLAARVFALVDTLDAITSDRPYRKGRRFEEAFREIGRASGGQFDPVVVDVFLSVPVSAWRQARSDVRLPGLLPSVN
jgi:hypothetical protein